MLSPFASVILAVSALSRHKNVRALVQAMARVHEAQPNTVLVIPGNPTPHGDELETLARELGIGAAVRLPGWVSAADLEGRQRTGHHREPAGGSSD